MYAGYWIFAALLPSTLGAYVQLNYCEGSPNPASRAWSLTAALERKELTTLLRLNATKQLARKDDCNDRAKTTAVLEMRYPTTGATFEQPINATCTTRNRTVGDNTVETTQVHVPLSQDIGELPLMSSFHMDLRIVTDGSSGEQACLSADVTPALLPAMNSLLHFLPLGVLLFTAAGSFLEFFHGGEDDSSSGETSLSPRSRWPVLQGVGACLHHLQFVFLTGSLSLRYPGFYQPAVGNLNWFSLFSSSNAFLGGDTYAGVRDGIYEVNGTRGGTFGMEVMTQIIGAPRTMETWLNMLILIIILIITITIFIELHWLFSSRTGLEPDSRRPANFRRVSTQVLQVILSWFLLPIVSLSAYQIDNFSILPAYHISLAIGLIAVALGAFVWLIQQLPIRSLGYFILDSKAYQPLQPANRGNDYFILILFIMNFLRGMAIGGLQISGVAQLSVLLACEVISIVSMVALRSYPLKSIMAACAIERIVVLSLMITFLPGFVSLSARSIVAYLILILHTATLFIVILLPSAIRLARLLLSHKNLERPPVFNLRQLGARPSTQRELPRRPDLPTYESEDYVSQSVHLRALEQPGSPSTLQFEAPSDVSRFSRPSRSSLRGPSTSTTSRSSSLGTSMASVRI